MGAVGSLEKALAVSGECLAGSTSLCWHQEACFGHQGNLKGSLLCQSLLTQQESHLAASETSRGRGPPPQALFLSFPPLSSLSDRDSEWGLRLEERKAFSKVTCPGQEPGVSLPLWDSRFMVFVNSPGGVPEGS